MVLIACNLSSSYQNNDITEFEKILKTNHSNIMDDPFIREHIEGQFGWLLASLYILYLFHKSHIFIFPFPFRIVTEHKNASAHQID